jgi:hypothetical protein
MQVALTLLSIFLLLPSQAWAAVDRVIKTNDIGIVEAKLDTANLDTLVIIDVDNTIITPASSSFRVENPNDTVIADINRNRVSIVDYDHVMSSYHQQRQVILVSDKWPSIIDRLRDRGVSVYALAVNESGQLGDIKRVEEWQSDELVDYRINFSRHFGEREDFVLVPGGRSPAVFYHGVITTGSNSSGSVVRALLKETRYKRVIYVDDTLGKLNEVAAVCDKMGVGFTGILYRGVTLIEGQPSEEIVTVQRDSLIHDHIWLEDHAARHHGHRF